MDCERAICSLSLIARLRHSCRARRRRRSSSCSRSGRSQNGPPVFMAVARRCGHDRRGRPLHDASGVLLDDFPTIAEAWRARQRKCHDRDTAQLLGNRCRRLPPMPPTTRENDRRDAKQGRRASPAGATTEREGNGDLLELAVATGDAASSRTATSPAQTTNARRLLTVSRARGRPGADDDHIEARHALIVKPRRVSSRLRRASSSSRCSSWASRQLLSVADRSAKVSDWIYLARLPPRVR